MKKESEGNDYQCKKKSVKKEGKYLLAGKLKRVENLDAEHKTETYHVDEYINDEVI